MDTPVQYSEKIYTAGATDGFNNFTPPDYVADSGGYTHFTSTLVVEVNGVTKTITTDYTLSSTVDFNTALTAGAIVRIYRKTERSNPLVTFPNTTQLDAQKHLNKNTYQLLWLFQEVWTFLYGCVYKVYSSVHNALVYDFGGSVATNIGEPVVASDMATKGYTDGAVLAGVAAEANARANADSAIYAYIASTIAALSTSANLHVTSKTGTVTEGDTYIDLLVPFGSFTGGQLNINGVVLDVATTCTLSSNAGNTRVTLPEAVSADGNYLILMF